MQKEANLTDDVYRLNDEVRIVGYEEDCGIGIVEGKIESGEVIVRLKAQEFTKKGIQHLRSKKTLNPNGQYTILFCIPSRELVSVSTYKAEIKNDERRAKGKGRKKTK